MRFFKNLCVALICFLLSYAANSQERYFTQFYSAPLLLDPSLTGNFDGNYRVNMAFRDQWFKNLEKPFSVFEMNMDLSFDLQKHSRYNDYAGAGLFFATDKAGPLSFGNTEMGIAGSYRKFLGPGQFLSGGLYVSLVQRNINFTNITFEDQFNGEDGYTAGTGESLGGNNFAFFDQGIGISYSNYKEHLNGFNFGIAMAHPLRPEVSFLKRDDVLGEFAASFRLPIKYTAHAGGKIILNDYVNLYPRFLYIRQGVQDMGTLGLNVRFDSGVFGIHLGAFGRAAGGNFRYNFDSAGILAGLEYLNWQVGISYDAAIPNIIHYSRNQGTFEITLSYFGKYFDDNLMCPTF